jgi:hypothetical protein
MSISVIGGIGLLLLLAMTLGSSNALALRITEPTDGGAIGTTIGPGGDQPAAVTLPPARRAAGNPLWAVPLRLLNVTRERPLFSPSRRPPAVAMVAVPSTGPQPAPRPGSPDHPLLTLVGTVVGKQQRIGVFVDQASKKVISLKIGQGYDGWTLRTVGDRDAVFQRHQREVVLALPARSATDQAAIPAVNAAAGTWMDGDGQMIGPPPAPNGGLARPSLPSQATWTDGDGQLIAPPPVQLSNGGQ